MLTKRLEVRPPQESDRARFVEPFGSPEFMVFSGGVYALDSADLSAPARLRRDLRSERGSSAAFARASEERRRELDRTKRLLARALDAEDELEATIERLRATGDYWRSRAVQPAAELNAKRERHDQAQHTTVP